MSKYNADSIKVLKGLEAVRKRPGMYIGSTDVNGLHHLVWEIIDNSIDEVLANFATKIKITIKKDGSIIIEDNGRGIPVDIHKESNKSAIELVFTELHAGGKFGQESGAYKVSGGLNGVGSSVVNALSRKLEARIYKNNKEYLTGFTNGQITQKTKVVGTTTKRGTKIQFWPNYTIFKNAKFNFNLIKERVREASFLIPGLEINLRSDGNVVKNETYKAKNGLKEFVEFINESKNNLTRAFSIDGKFYDIDINIAFQYTDDYNPNILGFVNNIKTSQGGTHVEGLKSAWTKIINEYARTQGLLKVKEANLSRDDIIEGLTAIVSVRIPEKILGFVGQTKDILRTPEAKKAIEDLLNQKLIFWLQENKKEAYKIVTNATSAARARKAARKARQEAKKLKKVKNERQILSGKLTPAQSKNPEEKELFLVEGDSAGGSAKLGRDRKFQAILPLRGKVINTEKAKLIDIIKNEEIATIINTIGAGVGTEFEVKDAQYGKIVIMTDADTDGAHIQALLLTFLFRYMRALFEEGKIYIAQPPLYKITNKTIEKYAWDERELQDLLQEHKHAEIQRYKGLGEMNADQLWETTMNPKTRTLIKVSIGDAVVAERRVSTLMGDKVEPRRDWINQNVQFTLEDDFGGS